jgi:CMP-N-acetylneuraminic acid synthetase
MEAGGFHPEIVAVMQANLPLRPEGQIDATIERLEALPEATAVCTAVAVRYRPEWAKVLVEERTGEVKPFMAGRQPWRKQDLPRLFAPDGAVLVVRRRILFETEGQPGAHVWLGERLHILPQADPAYAIEVDYPDEIPVVEYHLRRLQKGQGPSGQD